jgi:hypothetical protein
MNSGAFLNDRLGGYYSNASDPKSGVVVLCHIY